MRDDAPHIVLYDRSGLSEPVALDADFAEVLDLLDGTRTRAQIRQSLRFRGLNGADLDAFVDDLREAGLLEGDEVTERYALAMSAYFNGPARPSVLAHTWVPTDPDRLRAKLDALLPHAASRIDNTQPSAGVFIPLGPWEAQPHVLRATLDRLPPAHQVAAIVIVGTDFGTARTPAAIATQPYATPLGIAPLATATIDQLCARMPWLPHEEIRHLHASSVEWAVLALQAVYGTCPPIVPLVCGQGMLRDDTDARTLRTALADLVQQAPVGQDVWVMGVGDLLHAGQALGREALVATATARTQWLAASENIATMACARNTQALHAALCEHPTHMRPTGGAALLTWLAALAPNVQVTQMAHALCESDDGTHARTIAGLRAHRATVR